MASVFSTPQSPAVDDNSGVIGKGCVSRVLSHMDSSTDTTGNDNGLWFWSDLLSGFIDCDLGLNVGQIYPVLRSVFDVVK